MFSSIDKLLMYGNELILVIPVVLVLLVAGIPFAIIIAVVLVAQTSFQYLNMKVDIIKIQSPLGVCSEKRPLSIYSSSHLSRVNSEERERLNTNGIEQKG